MGGREATQSFLRLFALPGVGHCNGGAGADTIDYLSYLEAWVEKNQPPERLLAAHMKEPHPPGSVVPFPLDPNAVAFTRPVYPYPLRATYKGHGDPNDAESFKATH